MGWNQGKLHSLKTKYQFKAEGFHGDLNFKEKLELEGLIIGKY